MDIDPFVSLYSAPKEGYQSTPLLDDLLDFANELDEYSVGDYHLPTIIEDIQRHTFGFVKIGLIAYKIKYLKLYKNLCSTFKDFCKFYLHLSCWQVNRIILASKVVLDLALAGFTVLPKNESQCRYLAGLGYDDLIKLWGELTTTFPPHKITADLIANYLKKSDGTCLLNLKLSPQLHSHIQQEAANLGLSVEQYLQQLTGLEDQSEVESLPEDKVANWLTDLTKIVTQRDSLVKLLFSCIQLLTFTPAPT